MEFAGSPFFEQIWEEAFIHITHFLFNICFGVIYLSVLIRANLNAGWHILRIVYIHLSEPVSSIFDTVAQLL